MTLRLLTPLLCLAAIGLAPAAPVPKQSDKPVLYFVTSVGARLVYDEEGGETVNVVTDVETRDGSSVVSVGRVGLDGKTVPKDRWSVSERGLWLLERDGQKHDPPSCYLKLPVRPGETWDWKPGKAPWLYTAGKPERVRVPAGEYEAVPVALHSKNRPPLMTHYYAPGVGLVKTLVKADTGDWVTSRVLKSFTPGKP